MARVFLLIRGVLLRIKVTERNKKQNLMGMEGLGKNLSQGRPRVDLYLW
jgi:hypothetical protein